MDGSRAVKKAVIPVAGLGTRMFPASKVIKKEFFPVVGPDGLARPLIHYVVEEALESGVEQVCLVVQPGGDQEFLRYFHEPVGYASRLGSEALKTEAGRLAQIGGRVAFACQDEQKGYGHAVACAREWVGDEPFMVLLGDHIHVSATRERCARQLIRAYERVNASVSAVARTPEDQLRFFGTVTGTRTKDDGRLVHVTKIVEKPSAEMAQKHLRAPWLESGQYLCFFGQHIFTARIFDCLERLFHTVARRGGEVQLTEAQDMLCQETGKYFAYETGGERFDLGTPAEYVESLGRLVAAWGR
jgi:UTP--glucose-1-phosphate uridylyltransferase